MLRSTREYVREKGIVSVEVLAERKDFEVREVLKEHCDKCVGVALSLFLFPGSFLQFWQSATRSGHSIELFRGEKRRDVRGP